MTQLLPSVRGAALLERIDYSRIESPGDRDRLYRMRHRAYVDAGLMEPRADGMVVDGYDEAPNAWIFGVHLDGELRGSVRIHLLDRERRTSFATELFGDVLHPRLDRGERFVDAARLAIDPATSGRHPDLLLAVVRLTYLACAHFDADTGLAQVRSGHEAFYRRTFRHHPIAGPRAFPGVSKTVSLLAADFRADRDEVLARFPIMRSNAFERRMLFGDAPPAAAAPAEAAE